MRNISFSLTTQQILDRTKTVTRRLGWKNLKPGTLLQACEKCMGLKKGERLRKLCVIRVVNAKRERLENINFYLPSETAKEGFPGMLLVDFMEMFCREMRCQPDTEVTRIEFEYV